MKTSAASRSRDLEEQVRDVVTQQPVVAVLVAVSLGFLVARLVSRR